MGVNEASRQDEVAVNWGEEDDGRASSEDGGHLTPVGGCLAEFIIRYPMGDDKQTTGSLNRSMLDV